MKTKLLFVIVSIIIFGAIATISLTLLSQTETIDTNLETYRKNICEEYNAVWDDMHKTCDLEAEIACRILEGEFKVCKPIQYSALLDFPNDPVRVGCINSCIFEESIAADTIYQQNEEALSYFPMYNAMVVGEMAEKACNYLELECPENPQFKANYNKMSDTVAFVYYYNDNRYYFKIEYNQLLLKDSETKKWVIINSTNPGMKKSTPPASQLESLKQMSCEEIRYNNEFEGIPLNKEDRQFVRDTISQCDKELFIQHEWEKYGSLSCEEAIKFDGKLNRLIYSVKEHVSQQIKDCRNE